MLRPLKPTQLILAPHIMAKGVLEVDAVLTDSDTLALLLHPNPKAGGNMMSKVITTLYRHCRAQGMSVVRFNYRGVGHSSGEMMYGRGEFLDALCVLSWALAQTSAKKLWLGGFSFGGFIACQVADAVLTKNYPDGFQVPDIELIKTVLIAPSIEKNNPQGLTLGAKTTYVIYGDKDEFVQPSSMYAFAQKFALPYKIVPDTTHFFHGKLNELKQVLQEIDVYIDDQTQTHDDQRKVL